MSGKKKGGYRGNKYTKYVIRYRIAQKRAGKAPRHSPGDRSKAVRRYWSYVRETVQPHLTALLRRPATLEESRRFAKEVRERDRKEARRNLQGNAIALENLRRQEQHKGRRLKYPKKFYSRETGTVYDIDTDTVRLGRRINREMVARKPVQRKIPRGMSVERSLQARSFQEREEQQYRLRNYHVK